MDISEEIDRSFGAGPPAERPGTESLLAQGRRALRRRRLATGAAAAAVVAVIGGSAWAAAGTGSGTAAPEPAGPAAGGGGETTGSQASDPTQTPAPRTETLPRLVVDPRLDHDLSILEYPDELRVTRGLEVTRRVDNPYDVPRPGWSVALDYTLAGQRYWYAGVYERGGQAVSQPVVRGATVDPGVSFREWVAEQETIRGGGHGPAAGPGTPGSDQWPGLVDLQLVRLDPGSDHLTPFGAVTMLQQRPHPDLPESWAGPDADSAVAEVRADGVRYYVLARRLPGDTPQYIAVTAEDGGATLDDFLELARQRYAEGGGGLL